MAHAREKLYRAARYYADYRFDVHGRERLAQAAREFAAICPEGYPPDET